MTINAGDIAFLGVNATDPDEFALLFLNGAAAGDSFIVTDGGYTGATSGAASAYFRTTEGFLQYTAPSGGLSAGSVLLFTGGGGSAPSVVRSGGGAAGSVSLLANGSSSSTSFAFSTSGDSLTAYRVTGGTHLTGTPILLAFIDFGINPYGSGSSNSSSIPTITGGQVLDLGNFDNAIVNAASTAYSLTIAQLSTAGNFTQQEANRFDLSTILSAPAVTPATVSIDSVSTNEAAGTLTFTVTRSNNTGAFTLDYATADATATTADNDYVAKSGTLSFAAGGALTQTISVTVNDDSTVEPNETLTVGLSNLVSTSGTASIATATGTGTIVNDDVAGVSIADASVTEGDSGTKTLSFTVTRSDNSAAFTVDFATADGTATAGSDYAAAAGTLSFAAGGALSQTVNVTVAGDVEIEGDETLTVTLSNLVGSASIGRATATGTILNDDAAATVSIGNASVTEGNSGTALLTFTVTRSHANGAFSLGYASGNGTATAGSDYVAQAGTLNFAIGGGLSQEISIVVNGDTAVESDETLTVTLADLVNGAGSASIATAIGTGTIVNDDAAPQVAWINEFHYDNTGTDVGEFIEIAGTAGLNLAGWSLVLYNGNPSSLASYSTTALSGIIGNQSGGFGTLNFAYASNGIQNGGTGASTTEGDAIALVNASGQLVQFIAYEATFTAIGGPAAGVTAQLIPVSEAGTEAAGGSLYLTGSGTQYSDFTWAKGTAHTAGLVNAGQSFGPVLPSVSVSGGSVLEGDSGTRTLTFTVTRTDTSTAFTVDYATTNGTATAGSDYVATTGTLTFAAGGAASQTVAITINGDTANEADETFTLGLSNIVNTTGTTVLGTASATGTIQNDDVALALIHDIQGSGSASPMAGQRVTIEGIITADFANGLAGSISGFFVQEEDADADANAATSEGIFVFVTGDAGVNVGDLVRVTGTVTEFNGETQLASSPVITVVSSGNALPTAATITFPVAGTVLNSFGVPIPDLEAYEGMLVTIPQALTVSELFNLDRYGEYQVSFGRQTTYTADHAPSVSGYAQHLIDIAKVTLTVDDGLRSQNPSPIVASDSELSTADAFRMGEQVSDLTGVIRFSISTNEFGAGSSNQSDYRLLPTIDPTFTNETANPLNPRDAVPDDVGGRLKVVSSNVLNYFTTLNNGSTMANGNQPRGANNETEFARQTQKLVTVMTALDADIVSLAEIENDFSATSSGNAVKYLVEQLNLVEGAGTWAWVNPGVASVGTDAIAVAMIYRTAAVKIATGTSVALLTDPVMSRPALAVTFEEIATGETITLVGNHLKSKSPTGASGANLDQLDGQGAFNAQRVAQAQAVLAWIATNPTGSSDPDYLILGDLNAYAKEDPITTFEAGGFVNVENRLANPYSYVFDAQVGSLDYILANAAADVQISGITQWHINADEADALDYNLDFGRPANIFDGAVAARASDHDPVLIGLNLGGLVLTGTAGNDSLVGASGDDTITGGAGNDSIDGGAGIDVALFSGMPVSTSMSQNWDGSWNAVGPDGTDLLREIEAAGFGEVLFLLAATAPTARVVLVNDTGVVGDNLTRDGRISGHGIGLRTVTVTDSATMAVLGTTSADATGDWSLDLSGLADGSYSLLVQQTDLLGVTNGVAGVLHLDTATAVGIATAAGTVTVAEQMIAGTAEAGAVVQLFDNGLAVGAAITVGSSGLWAAAVTLTLGSHSFTARAVDLAGNLATSAATAVTYVRTLGATGNDLLSGSENGELLSGGAGNDSIYAFGGDDTLAGGVGADLMLGGRGNDRYLVDNVGDLVVELPGEGIDLVVASISYTLTANVENLKLAGTADLIGTGNELDNLLLGNDGRSLLQGGAGNDSIKGYGNDDTLDGGTGNDTMRGGGGNDLYIVDSLGDVVLEGAAAGWDIILASVSFTLGNNVEQLDLGAGGLTGTGNTLANVIQGGTGNDFIIGGLGRDTLSGGDGADIFRYRSAAEGGDRILDFAHGIDALEFSAAGFAGGLEAGMDLAAGQRFVLGNKATMAFGQFIFQASNNVLYWDADGTGAGSRVAIATFSTNPSMTANDLQVVA